VSDRLIGGNDRITQVLSPGHHSAAVRELPEEAWLQGQLLRG
jgi:hypothetical protein